MNWVDISIITSLVLAIILGFKIGLVRAAFLLGAFIAAIVFSSQLARLPYAGLKQIIKDDDIRYAISLTVSFLIILIGVNFAGAIIYRLVNFAPLKWLDRWTGMALGFLVGIILVSLIVTYLEEYPVSKSDEWLKDSPMVPIIRDIASQILHKFLERDSVKSFTARSQVAKAPIVPSLPTPSTS